MYIYYLLFDSGLSAVNASGTQMRGDPIKLELEPVAVDGIYTP